MTRREFVMLAGTLAISWPADVIAQQSDRLRRIGVLMPMTAGDPVRLHRVRILMQGLQELGWTDGQNVRIEYRWTNGDPERIRTLAQELVISNPDVLVGLGTAQAVALRRATRDIPIVFVAASNL